MLKTRRERLLAQGKCVTCGLKKIVRGSIQYCKACREAQRATLIESRLRKRRKRLCFECGKRKVKRGSVRCVKCNEKNNAKQRARRAAKKHG